MEGAARRAPALARQPFYFLMMTSGVGIGGAHEVESQYATIDRARRRSA
jgi:hypothetical protein